LPTTFTIYMTYVAARVTSRKGINGDCIDNTTNVVYKEEFQNV